jgi:hypothetical protein
MFGRDGQLAFQEISFGKNRKRESKDRYYQADLYYVLLWNLLNWLPYHALKLSLMQYQANPSTNCFQTSHVALPWVIYSPYISRFCGDRLVTKTLQSPAVGRRKNGDRCVERFRVVATLTVTQYCHATWRASLSSFK